MQHPTSAVGSGTFAQTGLLPAPPSSPGAGTIQVNGGQIDVIGSLSFQGVASASLNSTGDIGLRGNESNSGANIGSLTASGELTLTAERVVPSTAATFTISDTNASGGSGYTVRFDQSGTASGSPLSVGGSLTVNADNIVQAGTILAPFGSIALNANPVNGTLTLVNGSTTSVSGNGVVLPYGVVENGTIWDYGLSNNALFAVTTTPTRQVALNGATVNMAPGATVNVSGGGDLTAYHGHRVQVV